MYLCIYLKASIRYDTSNHGIYVYYINEAELYNMSILFLKSFLKKRIELDCNNFCYVIWKKSEIGCVY